MKHLLVFVFMHCCLITAAQIAKDTTSQEPTDTVPISHEEFTELIVRDVTHAIVGEAIPVDGIKVDITSPNATIAGFFKVKQESKFPFDLIGLEIQGGAKDKNFNFLKGYKNINTAFELRVPLHRITYYNSAKPSTGSKSAIDQEMLRIHKNQLKSKEKSIKDSVYVIGRVYNYFFASFDVETTLPTDITFEEDTHKSILLGLIASKIDKGIIKDSSLKFDEIISLVFQSYEAESKAKKDSIFGNIVNFQTYYENLEKATINNHLTQFIDKANENWRKKSLFWWTLIPFGRTENVNTYNLKHAEKDSMYFKSKSYVVWGGNFYGNAYFIWPKKLAWLNRLGLSVSKNNNILNLSQFEYESRAPLFSSATSATEKYQKGSAYEAGNIKQDAAFQVSLESYLMPLNNYIPGLYISSFLNYSKLYNLPDVVKRENDKTQIGLETGLLFNIGSREKDKEKTTYSILAYFRHQDLTDGLRTSKQTLEPETKDDYRKRNISIGIKLGIPINLPNK